MSTAAIITSASNPLLKDVRRAVARGGLTARGQCVADGFHLLAEALRSGCEIAAVLAAEPALPGVEAMLAGTAGTRLVAIPDVLFKDLADTETSQGVIALVTPRRWTFEQLLGAPALVVVLDGVQDPGNAGSIVRAAEAFGASGAVFVKGTASPHHPRTLRAAAGSLFRLPVSHGLDAEAVHASLAGSGVTLFAAVPPRAGSAAGPLSGCDLTGPCALVIGSEAHGVSAALRTGAREISIPTANVESLNAAVAAGILLYEARRQRTAAP